MNFFYLKFSTMYFFAVAEAERQENLDIVPDSLLIRLRWVRK